MLSEQSIIIFIMYIVSLMLWRVLQNTCSTLSRTSP